MCARLGRFLVFSLFVLWYFPHLSQRVKFPTQEVLSEQKRREEAFLKFRVWCFRSQKLKPRGDAGKKASWDKGRLPTFPAQEQIRSPGSKGCGWVVSREGKDEEEAAEERPSLHRRRLGQSDHADKNRGVHIGWYLNHTGDNHNDICKCLLST